MSFPIPQKHRPISLIVHQGFNIPWFTLLHPRPEDIQYTHPSRGTVIQTFDGGFVDDFGEGLCDIVITGNTGWRGGIIPGEAAFFLLRDWIVLRFHALRKQQADAGKPIDDVKMFLVDTLNLYVYEVYPISFTGRKNKSRPLLYQYTIRLTGLDRMFGLNSLDGAIDDAKRVIGAVRDIF
jgi:hypothetical protein